jgi:predicted nucleotidyltransferase
MKDMLVKYIKKLPVIQAVLFGSTARGDEKPNSDIDLFLLVRSQTEKKEVEKSLDELRDRILTIYGNVLSDYILTEKEYGEKQGLGVVKNIKKEGVRIV